jgi:hypothetical protein
MDHADDPLIVFNILDDALQFQAIYSFRTALCKNFGPMRAWQNYDLAPPFTASLVVIPFRLPSPGSITAGYR